MENEPKGPNYEALTAALSPSVDAAQQSTRAAQAALAGALSAPATEEIRKLALPRTDIAQQLGSAVLRGTEQSIKSSTTALAAALSAPALDLGVRTLAAAASEQLRGLALPPADVARINSSLAPLIGQQTKISEMFRTAGKSVIDNAAFKGVMSTVPPRDTLRLADPIKIRPKPRSASGEDIRRLGEQLAEILVEQNEATVDVLRELLESDAKQAEESRQQARDSRRQTDTIVRGTAIVAACSLIAVHADVFAWLSNSLGWWLP